VLVSIDGAPVTPPPASVPPSPPPPAIAMPNAPSNGRAWSASRAPFSALKAMPARNGAF